MRAQVTSTVPLTNSKHLLTSAATSTDQEQQNADGSTASDSITNVWPFHRDRSVVVDIGRAVSAWSANHTSTKVRTPVKHSETDTYDNNAKQYQIAVTQAVTDMMLANPPIVVQLEVCGKWMLTTGKSSPFTSCTILVKMTVQLTNDIVGWIAQLADGIGGIAQLKSGWTNQIILNMLFKNCTPTEPPPPIPFPFPIPPKVPPPF